MRSPHGYQGSGVLVGGDAELGRLRALIDPALEGSRLLVVLGAAGMGKSVLLADTAQRARAAGMRVLAVTGLEPGRIWRSQRLFRPVLADVAELPQRQGMAQRGLSASRRSPSLATSS